MASLFVPVFPRGKCTPHPYFSKVAVATGRAPIGLGLFRRD